MNPHHGRLSVIGWRTGGSCRLTTYKFLKEAFESRSSHHSRFASSQETLTMASKAAEVSGSQALVVPFNQQDFEKLRNECLQTKTLFCDPTFPATLESLGDLKPDQINGLEWKRPTELRSDPQFIADGATRTDICQGSLGDCWLVASMACLTMDPQILDRVVPPAQSFKSQYAGIFHFQLWHFGQWVDVVVDDRLPARKNTLVFSHSVAQGEFWSALLEKAHAKVSGSYKALADGHTPYGLELVTGGMSETYDLVNPPPCLFNTLQKALTFGSLLACSIHRPSETEKEKQTAQQLVMSHAYSITAAEQVHHLGVLVDLLRLRNPWGHKEWTGAWSDSSKEWNEVQPDEKNKLYHCAEDGEFWISFNDFLTQFTNLYICHLMPDTLRSEEAKRWRYAMFEGEWKVGSAAGGSASYPKTFCSNPQFFIHLEDVDNDPGCTVLIGLMQKVLLKDEENLKPIGFRIYKVPDGFKGRDDVRLGPDVLLKQMPAAECKVSRRRDLCERFKLPPGDYVIVPYTHKPDLQGRFVLRVFTEKQ